jgi:EAL domain-containing protein (putative c-di-GMP-specific phosphodiesterase class I)
MFDAVVGVVLDLALGACCRWWEAGWRVPVSVIDSASDLRYPAVVEQVAEVLDRHGLPAQALVIEVTEETLMIDPGGARTVLERLRGLGVQVSIDDFGSGYSSFAYLRALPADELKLDALFIQDLAREPTPGSRPATIVRTVADLAHALGLRLVTEGIEDGRVAALLHLLGADVGQGFHLGRPMPLADLLSWLSQRGQRDLSGSSPAGERRW